MNTDAEWEKWGKSDPYYGVITNEMYRRERLSEEVKEKFFVSGAEHIERVLEVCRKKIDPRFEPRRAMDFGCGVGRVLIPMAKRIDQTVGIDVSQSMLDEVQRNCSNFGIGNVKLILSQDNLEAMDGQFDFIHSFIVLQHIPSGRGLIIFRKLLSLLVPKGIAAIQITYSTELQRIQGNMSSYEKFKRLLWRKIKRIRKLVAGELRSTDPKMLMSPYDLREVMVIIQQSGIQKVYSEFTDHQGTYGMFLYLQKP